MKGPCSPFVLLAVWGALGMLGGLAKNYGSRRGVEDGGDDNSDSNSNSNNNSDGSSDGGSDVPSTNDFIRRGCHTVAVLGDYLYIDGGSLTERVDGSKPADSPSYDGRSSPETKWATRPAHSELCLTNQLGNAVNTTWSIDLTVPWTSEDLQIRSIPKKAPALNKQIHWTDPSTKSLYTWGGFTSDDSSPSQGLWRFTPDGSGGGAWNQVTQRNYAKFSKLRGTYSSAFTQTKDAGFAFGGAATKSSDASVHKERPGYATPGLISYNFQTGEWDNSTTSAYGGYGTSLNARAEYVPFGPNGLIMFLGGAESPVDATNETIVEMNWNQISMVDPVTKRWYKQTTSGTRPPTIESHCSVGVPGPNGTYEIFLYGGISDQLRGTSPEVYVLSLPGFVFFKGPNDAPPRSDHQCVVVGKGQRQMLSVGGVDGENRTFTAPTTADPWAYGIGILDMTELKWMDAYNPNATAYDSPSLVTDWYDGGHLKTMTWDTEEVAAIFMKKDVTPTPGPTDTTVASGSHSTSAIVGGAVGGVLGVAAIGMMSFLVVRRSRRARSRTPDSRRQLAPTESVESVQGGIAEYRPEPWPKDLQAGPGARYVYSPDSLYGGAVKHLPSKSPLPFSQSYVYPDPNLHRADGAHEATPDAWPAASELPGHQDDGMAGMIQRGAELPGTQPSVGELMDNNMQWAHEMPAPLESHRTELPDQKYS